MKEYLEKLFNSLFDSYNIQPGSIDLVLEIEDLELDVDTVIPIGLIVNELVSNALKYAFPGDRKGMVTVCLKEENARLLLRVSDNGIGMQNFGEYKDGENIGYELIDSFRIKMKGEMKINTENGTDISILFTDYLKVA